MPENFNHDPLSSGGQRRCGVLLLHGFTGSPHSLRPVAEFLIAHGFAVEMPRLPGHGSRWEDMLTVTRHDWLAEVDRAYWRLRQAQHEVVVFGLSMGGMLAIRESIRRETAGTILVNPFITDPTVALRFAGLGSHFTVTTSGISSDIAKEGVDEGAYGRVPLVSARELHRLGRETRPMLAALRGPVLYFRSRHDHVVPDSSHRYFQKKVTAPVKFIQLERSYHVATLDHDAPIVFEESLGFIEQIELGLEGQE